MSNDKPEPEKLKNPNPDPLRFKDVLREELEDLRPGLIGDTQDSGSKSQEFGVRLTDLIRGGDLSANLVMRPGDILIIPQSYF